MYAFHKRFRDGVLVLDFQPGFALDHSSLEDVRHELSYWSEEHPFIALDLSHLRYANAQGLGVLLQLFKRLDRDGGCVAMFAPTDRVADILEVTGVKRLVPVFANEDQALDHLLSLASGDD